MDEIQIFISYAREDQTRVRAIYDKLVAAGFRPWLDQEHILPGQKWEPVIKQALKRSHFVLVCLSATSINKRGFLQKEIKQALEQADERLEGDVYLIPARLDDCEVPELLSRIQWTDLFKEVSWEKLLRAFQEQLSKLDKPMPPPALEEPQWIKQIREAEIAERQRQEQEQERRRRAEEERQRQAEAARPPERAPPNHRKRWLMVGSVVLTLALLGWVIWQSKSSPKPGQFPAVPNIETVYVPGGSFLMGSPDHEGGEDEHPRHPVTVQAFNIGKYEVTQQQWRAVMVSNSDPSYFKGDNLPVQNVSWDDAKEFCSTLSQMTPKTYRLPNEAEWEYACRAGNTEANALKPLGAMAWYSRPEGPHPVGTKDPNDFGLYDMRGNVYEWCRDVYHINYHDAPPDGSAWISGDSNLRVARGGAWKHDNDPCRFPSRSKWPHGTRDYAIGFRVVMSARTR